MNLFLLDLLDDLRQKRLAPVAIALLVALVAIPVVLMKPAADDSATEASAREAVGGTPGDGKVPLVRAVEEGPDGGSHLGVFDPKDPFKSGVKAPKAQAGDGVAQLVNPLPSSSGSLSAPDGSRGQGSGGSPPARGGAPSPAPGATPPPAPRAVAPRRVAYTYVADVTFTRNDRSRRIRSLDRLDMLPSQRSPLLIFLGVTTDGDHAVFLVDSTLEAKGEGRCSPKASECATLSIGAGSEHGFTDPDGNAFLLRINEIRKVRVSKASSSSRRRVRARTATGTSRRFVPPVLADIFTVASPDGHRSSGVADDR